jgi:hypothetical protein
MDKTILTRNGSSTSLANMEQVQIDRSAMGRPVKFIMAEISDGNDKKTVFKSKQVDMHNELYLALREETGFDLKVKVKGGGRIYLDTLDKTIWVWGLSTEYGYPDYKNVVELLQNKYEDFKIAAIPTMQPLQRGFIKDRAVDTIAREGDPYDFIIKMKDFGVNKKIIDGKTALHIAVDFCDELKVIALANISDLELKDDKGRTALRLAEEHAKSEGERYRKIVEALNRARKSKNE